MAVHAMGTAFFFERPGKEEQRVGRLSGIGAVAPGMDEIDVTTLDAEDGCRVRMPGLRDAGEIELTGFHTKEDPGQRAIRAAYGLGEVGEARIVFPDGCEAAFSAFVRSYTIGAAEVDGAIAFKAVLRPVGKVTFTE